MQKFLKLVSENTPGAQDEFTITLTDPLGEVINQFVVKGNDFAFDNFQEFKEEMVGVAEDGEMDVEKITSSLKAAEAITGEKDAQGRMLQGDPKKKVRKAIGDIYNKVSKNIQNLAKEI